METIKLLPVSSCCCLVSWLHRSHPATKATLSGGVVRLGRPMLVVASDTHFIITSFILYLSF